MFFYLLRMPVASAVLPNESTRLPTTGACRFSVGVHSVVLFVGGHGGLPLAAQALPPLMGGCSNSSWPVLMDFWTCGVRVADESPRSFFFVLVYFFEASYSLALLLLVLLLPAPLWGIESGVLVG